MNFNSFLAQAMSERNLESLDARAECAKRFPALVAVFEGCTIPTQVHPDLFLVDFPGRGIHIVAEPDGYRVRHGELSSWMCHMRSEPLESTLAKLAAHIAEDALR